MGLNERRKMKELQEVTLPERVREIEEICGKAIPYEVDWDSLADDAEGLKLIKLKNVKDKSAMQMTFKDGVLDMHCAYAQRTDGMHSDNAIREVLIQGL
jgi:hypothetical protein